MTPVIKRNRVLIIKKKKKNKKKEKNQESLLIVKIQAIFRKNGKEMYIKES